MCSLLISVRLENSTDYGEGARERTLGPNEATPLDNFV